VLVVFLSQSADAAGPIESLHAAAKNGTASEIQALVSSGVDVDAVKDGGTPLLTATNWNNYEAVKALVALKANVNFAVGQWTPLIRAAGRDTRIVKLLIDSGADVNYADPVFGYTALSYAANNRPETFEQLAKKGSYKGLYPNTPQTVALLIAAKADVNHRDKFGNTSLRVAVLANNIDIVRLLVKAGADVNEHNPTPEPHVYTGKDDPVLFDMVSGFPRIHITIADLLLEGGADANFRDPRPFDADFDARGFTSDGYTPLTLAARWGHLPVVELLLNHGADPCVPRDDGAYAASIAEEHGYQQVATMIRGRVPKCGIRSD